MEDVLDKFHDGLDFTVDLLPQLLQGLRSGGLVVGGEAAESAEDLRLVLLPRLFDGGPRSGGLVLCGEAAEKAAAAG